jgi:hypothetical protein
MINLWHCKWLQFFPTAFVWFFAGIFCTQAEETNLNIRANTDGIFASGKYFPDWPGKGHLVSIIIHFNPPNTNVTVPPFPRIIRQTNGIVLVQDPVLEGKYFMATNSFCGFVEMHNAAGDTIPLLKPEVASQEAYPASYSLKLVSLLLANNVGRGSALPGVISGANAELSFHLTDYFKIEEPGNYQLTVWPKIYKRVSTNDDICQRIDLPPVTVTIKWDGVSNK